MPQNRIYLDVNGSVICIETSEKFICDYVMSLFKPVSIFYKGKIDGILGKRTRLAIKKYQKTRSLKADGILGDKTKLCLAKEG